MEKTDTPNWLARFAADMESDGIESVPADVLAAVVQQAREAQASDVVIGVLVDPTEPAVARERAFAKLATRIIGHHRPSRVDTGTTPCSRTGRGAPRDDARVIAGTSLKSTIGL